ncbi:MAG: SurA N-terminal domain-containing protein [Treponema sp.]|jgi:hypothetical protein|nr:SurA N-terminal domain-containing protein [Treponema sp.]
MAFKGKKPAVREENSSKDELIRRFKANPAVFTGTVVILIIVIVSFVLVPALAPESGGGFGDLVFGVYNKIPVKYVGNNYFSDEVRLFARNRQSEITEENYPVINFEIWQQAYIEAVIQTAILDEMNRSGYTASDKLVNREVAMLPDFQENGRYSPSRYQALDSSTRLNLWQKVRDKLIRERYEADIGEMSMPEGEIAFIAGMAGDQRSFDMVSFSTNDYPEEEQTAFAFANPDLFTVTRLSKITVNSGEQEAARVLASIKDGTTSFEEAARSYSQDEYAEQGGDMGIKMAFELSIEVSETAARDSLTSLGAGEYSGVLQVPSGWAFFRAEEAPRAAVMEDELTKQKIRSYLMEYERGRMADWAEGEALAFIALVNEYGFTEAANQKNITKQSFGPLPVNYGSVELFPSVATSQVAELQPGATDENFWLTAFSTPLYTPSEPVVLGRNVVVLFPLEETGADESVANPIQSYSSYWMSLLARQSIRSHFLTSEAFEDGFVQAYRRYVAP